MKITFIRHGETEGNLKKQYIGKTNQPLCGHGIAELKAQSYPTAELVVSSPMKRCVQTAKIIYGSAALIICDALKECDFGAFEGKNSSELAGNSAYSEWLDSGGSMPFPGGEAPEGFKRRCCEGFEKATADYCGCQSIAFVVHGGTIMAVLEKYAVPRRSFYDFQVKNACGYITEFDISLKEISIIAEIK